MWNEKLKQDWKKKLSLNVRLSQSRVKSIQTQICKTIQKNVIWSIDHINTAVHYTLYLAEQSAKFAPST